MALHFLYFLSSSSFSRSFSKKSYFYTYFGPCPSILDPFFAKITKEKASAGAKAIYSFGQLLPLAKATEATFRSLPSALNDLLHINKHKNKTIHCQAGLLHPFKKKRKLSLLTVKFGADHGH